ncbi:MAG TPA: tRNA uridine-5-carboxymethylaminomethyl(34) synthesis GTPase MnmE [Candidatus Polarisedimenticolia bacterium]|nr:tRNA uridine-5-carboxymethylaminomethyl(34) synthesis GTPase MnmE [Candidatus Polarisedimenticolia bacterium]
MLDDTIAAIATPIGEGGLAVIRISGAKALAVADSIFSPVGKHSAKPSAAASHTIQFGHIVRDGKTIDEVLVAVMRAPRTFTREDVVEITCHGGILPAKMVLDAALGAGARLAEPGEFTRRAFLNGRIDLAQAEAVADVIHSRTELALSAANEQLAGKLSQRINQLRDDMLKTLAHVEAYIDFPEEDIAEETKDQLLGRLERGVAFMDELLHTANEGQILRRGIRAAIIGRPNAGKSSLLNQLLGHERAIVSPIPGTTRDTIEETANIRGLPVVFIDTAGLREARDEIEVEGIRRSRESLQKAEFILHVLDVSEPLTEADENYLAEFAGKKRILIRNKIDLPARLNLPDAVAQTFLSAGSGDFPVASPNIGLESPVNPQAGKPALPVVDVCCISGKGIEALKDAIKNLVWSGEIKTEMLQVMINSRHQDALTRAREATLRTIAALRSGATLELAAMDLRIAVNAVGEIVGKTATEDLLDMIFSQFCIGK